MRLGMMVFGVFFAACARGEPPKASGPKADPIVVPPAAEETTERSVPPPPRTGDPVEEREPSGETRASFELRVDSDGGNLRFSSTPDSGVHVWGSFNPRDGGFSFSGGFSTHALDAGAP